MERPNIIWIMADDMGFGDVHCFNTDSRIPTPHMDALAARGMRFIDAHSPSAVCTPTRYSVLTGRYCWRTHLKQGVIGGYSPPLIEPDRLTVASMLKQAGYATACIGKWHVGLDFHDKHGQLTNDESDVDFSQPVSGGPTARGFDYAFFNPGCGTCAPPYGFVANERFIDESFKFFACGETSGPVAVGGAGQWPGMMGENWVTKDADILITQEACAYLEERASEDEPFFLYLTPNAPHEPCVERFVPEFARGQSQAGARGDLVWLFDWAVGQVVQTLQQTGQLENTLIFVTSDNGALPGDFVLDEYGQRVKSEIGNNEYLYHRYEHKANGDWRGYKAHIWEGGHREPLIASWPGRIDPGSTCDHPVCLVDFMATCAAIVGYEMPAEAAVDSFNILPALLGDEAPARETLIHHSSFGVFSVRRGRWKLILGTKGSGGWPTPRDRPPVKGSPGQLYDLATDPAEERDLFEQRGDVVAELSALLETYIASGRSVARP